MRAVLPHDPSRSEIRLGEVAEPEVGAGEVLVRVRATALNRADLLQMRGAYPPPPGESEVPGLECAGTVETLGDGVAGWSPGERVMALLAGGGHAERVAVPSGQLMAIPDGLSFAEAAALPEVAITAWTNLVAEGGLKAGQRVLISAAASGVGTFAVQLARARDAEVLVAGRSAERLERLKPLGAHHAVVLGDDLPETVDELTGGGVDLVIELTGGGDGDGVDLVIDLAGGRWTPLLLRALRPRGRLVLVGVLAGARAEIDLGDVLRRRLRLRGSVLRARSRAEKGELIAAFVAFAAPHLADGTLRPVVDRVLPFAEIADAYAQLAAGGILGKIVLELDAAKS